MSATTPTRTARSKGVRESLLDMGRSLGLMAVIVLAVLLLTPARGLIWPDRNDRMPAADYSSVVQGFAEITHHSALTPHGLPSSWRANASSFARPSAATASLHIGWVVGGQRFVGLDETSANGAVLIRTVLGGRGTTVDGTTSLGGAVWQLRTSDRGERALTRVVDGVTVVVTGNATSAEMEAFCLSLR